MPETVTACPLCSSPKSSLFDRRTFRGQTITNRLCQGCGLVYQSPRMTAAEASAFYEEEYRRLYQGSAGPDAKDLAVQRGRAQALLAFARDGVKSVERHLDIGCSAGLLLGAFQKAYGCLAVGIEPGKAYRQYARQHGFIVYSSLEKLRAGCEERFELVSLAHVLEHLPDPVDYLAALRRNLLCRNGRLLVEAPNLYAHDSFEIAHQVAYSAHTLAQVLQKAGFEILYFEEHGRPRSELLPLYLTVLARPAAPGAPPSGAQVFAARPASGGSAASGALPVPGALFQVIPEKGVRMKRWKGMLRRALLTRLYPRRAWLPIR